MRQSISKKSYIVHTLLILFSSIIIPATSTSALSYQTDVGVSFTFNPTLSVSISSSDLVISNLTPGTTDTSNEISVNVSTNNVYGYNLYATVGNSAYSNTNLTHSSSNDTFTSIPTTANLANLATDNTWGYTYSLDNGTTWSKYNGLPIYNTDSPTRLIKTTELSEDAIDFKIAAKSSPTQASGTYTNVINFTAITNLAPITLAEAYKSEGKELYHGYYRIQDMSHAICEKVEDIGAGLQVIDIRDDKVYWIAKLADNNCWMTQNLDLDIIAGSTNLTSNNTDLSIDENVYTANNTIYALKGTEDNYGYAYENGIATWIPERSTIAYDQLSSATWTNSNITPYSYDRLESNGDLSHPDNNVIDGHGLSGNYYNYTAAIASNNSNVNIRYVDHINSICPSGWQLPSHNNNNFGQLLADYHIIASNTSSGYIENVSSVNSMGAVPLYFIRGGYVDNGSLSYSGSYGNYWSKTSLNDDYAFLLNFYNSGIRPRYNMHRYYGFPLRCLAR